MTKISEKELFQAISKALDIDSSFVNIESSIDNIDEWDSLGSLSILTSLDEISNGETSNIDDISKATSCKELIKILRENNLYD
tara:strand:+ start:216 stop:464 length:249 start_codon:yes stop_codon:yes gene_type:complete